MAKLSLPRAFTGEFPVARHSKREKRVIETAKNTLLRGTDCRFEMPPLCVAKDGAGAAVGTDATANLMLQDGVTFEYQNIGTQTILSPVWSSSGLNIGRDQTDNEGTELTQGITSRAKHAYTVGTDAAVFAEVTLTVADVSGTDDLCFGWRKAEAYQAAVDDYDEAAFFNVNAGTIEVETILNNGTTTTTDSGETLADAGSVTLRVEVDANRYVWFYVDGTKLNIARFQFDDGEVIVPFLYFINATDLAGAVTLTSWKCGLVGK